MACRPTLFDHVLEAIEGLPPDLRHLLATNPDYLQGVAFTRLAIRLRDSLTGAGENAAVATLSYPRAIFDAHEGVALEVYGRLASPESRTRRAAQIEVAKRISGFLKSDSRPQAIQPSLFRSLPNQRPARAA